MRIILDCDLMKYRNSGLYHYCLNLGNHVKSILDREKKDSIRFYIPSSESGAFAEPDSRIIERKWHTRYFSPFLWNCDIWHAPFQTGRILPSNRRIKILLTIHDLNVLHEDKPEKEKIASLNKTQKLIDGSDAVVCISNHTKKDVLENLNTRNKPIYVIHNGTHKIDEPIITGTGYKPLLPFIFTLGYVNRKKNFHTLLALLQDPGMELVIAGRLDEPDYIDNIRKQAIKEGISDRVHILGPVPEEDKAWYFHNCRAFVLPSLAEGFGAPVVEAMSYGKPIFLSERTSLPEIGGDVCSYFSCFEPSHMIEVFDKGMRRHVNENLGPRIIARGGEFKWDEKAKQYVGVYQSLLKESHTEAYKVSTL